MPDETRAVEGRLKGAIPGFFRSGMLGSIWRHKLLFVGVFVGFVVLALVAAFVIPPRYLATGLVIVAEADPATQTSDVWAQKQGDPADLESQIMILRSARLMKLALSQPGALKAAEEICRNIDDGCADLTADSSQLAERIAERYAIGAVGRSRVLSISYTSSSPEDAMIMANALVTAYLDDQRGSESNSRAVAAKWLWQEVSGLDKEIREQTKKIDAYRRKNGLVQGAKAPISSEKLTSTSEQLATAEQGKAQAYAKLEAIRDIKSGRNVNDYSALDNRTVGDLKQQIAMTGNELAASSAILGSRHPKRQMLEASLAVLQRQLKSEIDRIAASAEKDYETASNLVVSLRQQVDAAKEDASNALANESSLEGMLRDVDAKRQLYTQLYQRASELETERRSLSGGGRLVSLAEKPLKPNFPKKVPMLAAGFALGLFFAAASCIVRDRFSFEPHLDEEIDVHSPMPFSRRDSHADNEREEQIEDDGDTDWDSIDDGASVPVPIIGALPNLPSFGQTEALNDNLLTTVRRSMLSVGFKRSAKMLASDLDDASRGRPLLILPAHAGRRSSAFLTIVVGMELVARGKKVLAIECTSSEFAQGFVHRTQNTPTISSAITGAISPAACAVRTHMKGFDVIAGDDDILALLGNGSARGLGSLIAFAQTYDVVLITGPSLLEPRCSRVVRHLVDLGSNVVVCVDRDGRYEKSLVEAASRLGKIGLRGGAAILTPILHKPASNLHRLDRRESLS